MRETGVMTKIQKKWFPTQRKCKLEQKITADLIDVSTLFLILASGVFFSIIILFIESFVSVNNHKVKKT